MPRTTPMEWLDRGLKAIRGNPWPWTLHTLLTFPSLVVTSIPLATLTSPGGQKTTLLEHLVGPSYWATTAVRALELLRLATVNWSVLATWSAALTGVMLQHGMGWVRGRVVQTVWLTAIELGGYLVVSGPTALASYLGALTLGDHPSLARWAPLFVVIVIPFVIATLAVQARLWFVPVFLLEGATARGAIEGSWALVRGSTGRVLAVQTLTALVQLVGLCCWPLFLVSLPLPIVASAAALADLRAEAESSPARDPGWAPPTT